MGNALRKDVAVFHQVPAKSVDALGALPHQEIAGSEHDAVRLLLSGLDRNEAHARPLGRLTDGLGIGRIVLLPSDERLDVGRRDQAHMMAQLSDLTRPVVRAGTGFHRNDTRGLRREKTEKLPASDALAKQHMPGTIRSMYLEHVLRDVQTDRGSLLHGRLLRWQFDTVTLAHRCRRGASTPSPAAAAFRTIEDGPPSTRSRPSAFVAGTALQAPKPAIDGQQNPTED